MQLLLGGLLGGASSAAAGGAGAATAAATTVAGIPVATGGLSLSSLLQGTASVLGIVSTIGAGNAEAARAEMEASDADAEQSLENLQGIQRRSSIKRQLADAVGAQDVAYAASGVDLGFGTASNARSDAYSEADLALTSDAGTQQTRQSRLTERAANYRIMRKQSKRLNIFNAFTQGLSTAKSFMDRG